MRVEELNEEIEYLEEYTEYLQELVEELTTEVLDLERLISVQNKSLIQQEKEIEQLEEDLRNTERIGSLIHSLKGIDWNNNPDLKDMVLQIVLRRDSEYVEVAGSGKEKECVIPLSEEFVKKIIEQLKRDERIYGGIEIDI